MCGISGMAGVADSEVLKAMNAVQRHRGPDDSGIWMSPDASIGLAADRLSIIDLTDAGHMPMVNDAGDVSLVYNGETSNFIELRHDLEGLGHVFRSRSDTEVLLHGYEQWGIDLFRRLNGMFAVAIADLRPVAKGRPAELILARDRFGIKPLYYWQSGGRMVFASEVKAMLCSPQVRVSPNLRVLPQYLSFLYVPGPETMFDGVLKLPPAHVLRWTGGEPRVEPYWELTYQPGSDGDEDLAAQLRAALDRAVRRNLISDVPVGLFLSGGLDSSTIAALAAAASGSLDAYSIRFRTADASLEQSADDIVYARSVAKRFGARLHEIELSPEVAFLLPKVVYHLDEPVADPAAIATYLICQSAKDDLKVLLSGQGADEIFAGYRTYWLATLGPWLQNVPASVADRGLKPAVSSLSALGRLPGISPGLALAARRYLLRALDGAGRSPAEQFIGQHRYFSDSNLGALLSPDVAALCSDSNADEAHLRHFQARADDDRLNRMLYVDARTFLPDLNLTYSDKLSSANSVELRVPFLDNEVVELMARVPPRLKLRGLKSKYLLKEAVRGLVPDDVIRRRKAGFGAPIRSWLRHDLREMVDDLLGEQGVQRRGYFEPETIRSIVEADRTGQADNTYRIWALLTLEVWHQGVRGQHKPNPAERAGPGCSDTAHGLS